MSKALIIFINLICGITFIIVGETLNQENWFLISVGLGISASTINFLFSLLYCSRDDIKAILILYIITFLGSISLMISGIALLPIYKDGYSLVGIGLGMVLGNFLPALFYISIYKTQKVEEFLV